MTLLKPDGYKNTSKRVRERLAAQDSSWVVHAACAGTRPNLWFTELGEPVDKAVEVCQSCPVRRPCLRYAVVTNQDEDTWGGLPARPRRELRRRWLRLRKAMSS